MFKTFEGNVVNASDAMDQAGLNWKVSKTPIYDNNGKSIPGYQGVMRSDNQEVLGIVKSRYTLLQNSEAFQIMDTLLNEGMVYHSASSYKGGAIVSLTAKLPKFTIEPVKGDIVEIRLSCSTSHDGSKSLRMIYAPYRLVCLNGLTTPDRDLTGLLTAKHTETMTVKINSVKNLFNRIRLETDQLVYNIKKLASKSTTEEMVDSYLFSVFGFRDVNPSDIPTRSKNIIAEVKNLAMVGKGSDIPGVKNTVWGVYNALTEYVDHYATVKGDNEEDSRRFSSLYGSNANLKTEAFNQALVIAS